MNSRPPDKRFPAGRIATLLVAGASAASAWLVYQRLILPGGPMGWDESSHALYGAIIADDLRRLDWVSLLYDTYRQVHWPPLHSWITGVMFVFTGPGDAAARGVSAVCLAAFALLLFFAGRCFDPEHGLTTGLLAAGLALTSPATLRHASVCLLEMPSLAVMALTLLLWFQATESGVSNRRYILVGAGVLAAYLAKTNYGIVAGLSIAASEVLGSRRGFQNLFTK